MNNLLQQLELFFQDVYAPYCWKKSVDDNWRDRGIKTPHTRPVIGDLVSHLRLIGKEDRANREPTYSLESDKCPRNLLGRNIKNICVLINEPYAKKNPSRSDYFRTK